jgi:hypothetical protein
MNRLSGQTKEVINRNFVVSLAIEKGFNVFLPVYDGGVDFILYREGDRHGESTLLKVQLKSRWTIYKKYVGRDIWIAFPNERTWYLVRHDEMVETAEVGVLASASWTNAGSYSRPKLSVALIAKYEP